MQPNFVHLRLHSEFSLYDSVVKIKPLVKAAAADDMPALALTDQVNHYGLVKFYNACLGAGIKPLLGADLWIENPDDLFAPFVLTALCLNEQGYLNLRELISRAFSEHQHGDRALIRKEWLFAKNEGLIVLSGAADGDIGQCILKGRTNDAKALAMEYGQYFPQRFYLELQRLGREYDEQLIAICAQFSHDLQLPLVATNNVRFLTEEDYDTHETRVAIGQGFTLEDKRRPRDYTPQQYLRSRAEMAELFADLPSALANTVEIAQRCSVTMKLGTYFLPDFPVPPGMDEGDFFRKISQVGLEDRLKGILDPRTAEYSERVADYQKRLDFELDIIIEMGFPGYFLIVMDFIQWAKDHNIPVGPGRGSGAGSLVAYALKITDLDPLEYDLLFERFLNPERVSMPDFDIDFCMDRREEVIQYVAETYGREAVSQIVTFGTMAARGVVRDVARAQGKPFGLADKLSKLIPGAPGTTLQSAIEEEPAIREFLADDDAAEEVWEMALKLEGTARQTGKHAGGVVIAPTKLTDFAATACEPDGSGLVTQFDKDDVEQAGLVKFDFLGLRTLTIIDWALETINRRHSELGLETVDINRIPLNDADSFALLKRAETTAVFQLESRGMKDLIRRLLPDNLEEMIALVALFRPGPLESGMVDDFINRKHGRATVAYPHPDFQHECLKDILEPTYGVIVYQEQVMQIAQALAGYTLGGADMLRRAMGKKKPEEMAMQRELFRDGAVSQGVDPELAMKIFDLVEKFAGYGFNKSHSAAYALVSYQTLWLKQHYPAAFMAAVMTSDMQNTDKVVTLIEECRDMKLTLILPDVNQSHFGFTVEYGETREQDAIIYGLGAVKGVGEGPIDAIVAAREAGGPFTDVFDFCERVEAKRLNKRVLEALVRSGAFDRLSHFAGRSVLMASLEDAMKSAGQSAANEAAGMMDLFGEIQAEAQQTVDVYERYRHLHDWTLKERLQGEQDTLGLFVTGHPFDEYEKEIRTFVSTKLSNLQESKNPQKLAGLVVDLRLTKTKSGKTLAIVTLDDRSGRAEVVFYSDAYDEVRDSIEKDKVLVVEAVVSFDRYSGGLRIAGRSVIDVSEARIQFAKALRIKIKADEHPQLLTTLPTQLPTYEQGCSVVLEFHAEQASCHVRLGDQWRVNPTDELLQTLRFAYGPDAVDVLFS